MGLGSSRDASCSSQSSSSSSQYKLLDQLHENYEIKQWLSSGAYANVLECLKKDTGQTVAVKVPIDWTPTNELTLLEYFQSMKVDKRNIVEFVDSFTTKDDKIILVFEKLDVDLGTYFTTENSCVFEMHEIRSVVQQMATALSTLKDLKVIHGDIKFNNIMLVDQDEQPFKLKLIDFGLAFPTCRGRLGDKHQILETRAPEITLGLPFSEAIDMWSLGVLVACIILGDCLFGGGSDFEMMSHIVTLLGVPEDHLLSAGLYSKRFFVKTSNNWRLKTREEYGRISPPVAGWPYLFFNLDEMATLCLDDFMFSIPVTADEKMELLDLLKAMLQIDPEKRITPSQVLAHPFVTRGSLHLDSDSGSETSETTTTLSPGGIQPPKDACDLPWVELISPNILSEQSEFHLVEGIMNYQDEMSTRNSSGSYELEQSEANSAASESGLPSGVIMVKPAPPDMCLHLDEDDVEQPEDCSTPDKCLHLDEDNVEQPEDGLEERPFSTGTFITEHREPGTTSDIIQEQVQKKKKKNCFKRFSSWLKKTFTCRVSPVED